MNDRTTWLCGCALVADLALTRGLLSLPLIKEDKNLRKLLVVWPKIKTVWTHASDARPDIPVKEQKEATLESWIWDEIDKSYISIARKALMLSVVETRKVIQKGRYFGLIYPNSEINQKVLSILIAQTSGEIIDEIRDLMTEKE